jgi:hypothetical protein
MRNVVAVDLFKSPGGILEETFQTNSSTNFLKLVFFNDYKNLRLIKVDVKSESEFSKRRISL